MVMYRRVDQSEVDGTLQTLVELTVTAAAWHLGVSVPKVVWMRETTDTRGLSPLDLVETPEPAWGLCRLCCQVWLNVDMPQDQCIAVALHEMRHVHQFEVGSLPRWKDQITPYITAVTEADANSYAIWLTNGS